MATAIMSQVNGVRADTEKMLPSTVWENASRDMGELNPGHKPAAPFDFLSRPFEVNLLRESTCSRVRSISISNTSFYIDGDDTTTCPGPYYLPIPDRFGTDYKLVLLDDDFGAAISACLDRIANEVTVSSEKPTLSLNTAVNTRSLSVTRSTRTSSERPRSRGQPHLKSPITLKARRWKGKENSKVMKLVMDLEEHEYTSRRAAAMEDPSIQAMRAAESLDLATTDLQPLTPARIFRTTFTSTETSVWGLSRNGTQSSKRHSISDARSSMSRGRTAFKGSLRSRRARKRVSSLDSSMFILQGQTLGLSASSTALNSPALLQPRRLIRYSEMTTASLHVDHDVLSAPVTPVLFEFGEACLVPVPSLGELSPSINTQSVDGLFEKYKRASNALKSSPTAMKHAQSTMCLRDGVKRVEEMRSITPPSLRGQPRTVTVRPSRRNLSRTVSPPLLPSAATSCESHITEEKPKPETSDRGCSPIRFESNFQRSVTARSGDLRLNKPLPTPAICNSEVTAVITSRADGQKDHIMQALMNGYRDNTFGRSIPSESRVEQEDKTTRPVGRSIFNTTRLLKEEQKTHGAPQRSASTAKLLRTSPSSDKPSFAHIENKPVEARKDSNFTAFSFSPNAERYFTHISANVNAGPPTPATTPPPVSQRRKLSDFGILPDGVSTVDGRPSSADENKNKKAWKQAHQVRKLSDFGLLPTKSPLSEVKKDANSLYSAQLGKFEKFGIVQTGTEKVERFLESSADVYAQIDKVGHDSPHISEAKPEVNDMAEMERDVERDGYLSRHDTIDQILAMGCDDGVDQGVWTSAVARVEGMGMLGGPGVVGRLDMQYLMATAMESFSHTPHPTPSHTASPFASPDKLAALFAQHLERYLNSNQTVRILLITFPSSSLSTMFALRSLLNGSEGAKGVMKIAMVQNGRPSSPASSRGGSIPLLCKLSNEATMALNSRRRIPLAKLGAVKAASLLGNEEIPKPYSHKRQKTLGLGRRVSEESSEELPDFCLNAELNGSGVEGRKALETDVGEFVHCIRHSLALKNAAYFVPEMEKGIGGIANWSAAVVSQREVSISHSISQTSTGSQRRRGTGKLRKVQPGGGGVGGKQMGVSGGREILKTVDFEQRSEREGSWDWGRVYLALDEVGKGVDEKPFCDDHLRATSRSDDWEESDEEEEVFGDVGERCRSRQDGGAVGRGRGSGSGRGDMGKALKMLGIA